MIRIENLRAIISDNSITLFWDKPQCDADIVYQVMISQEGQFEKVAGETVTTHFTIEDMQQNMLYHCKIEGKSQAEDSVIASGEIDVKTPSKKNRIDVTKPPYMAIGDGKELNTARLQRAFDDCGPSDMVYIPAGTFMTGALKMHSNMELYLDENAILQGTDKVEDYLPKIKSRFEGTENESYSSLLNLGELDRNGGYSCQNVIIRGKGTIASGGKTLASRVISLESILQKDFIESERERLGSYERAETIPGRVRPRLIQMCNCQNIVLSGLTFKDGASWNIHMIYSDNIVTSNCTFYSENVWNGDGWDPDSSTNCTIFGCTFYTGDDSIAIKSGKNPEGNIVNKPTKHVRIFDCKCAFGHGIAIGSEMSGGIEDVRIWDCDMSKSLYGIEIKATKKRGGYVREVHVDNCKVSRIMFHSVGYNDDGIGAEKPPVFEKCSFRKVHIIGECYDHAHEWHDCDAIELAGFDEEEYEIKDILMQDIKLGQKDSKKKQTLSLQLCKNITLERIQA